MVYLPQTLIVSLDDYGREHGTGRGKSIQRLLQGVLDTPEERPIPKTADKSKVRLELIKNSNPLYIEYRKKHYIPNRGVVGQQLQYLIFYGGEVVGVIGGASAVYKSEDRDAFFGLSEEQEQFHDYVKKFLTDNVTVDEIRKIASGEDVALQQEIYGGLINLGINALLVPEEHGG